MKSEIEFFKMNGCGNDFIIIDNRKSIIPEEDLSNFAKKICRRRISLGADGLLLLEESLQYDFKMRLFNPDGTEGEMCGNGARCMAKFAFIEGIVNKEMVFETLAGKIYAEVGAQQVRIKLPDVGIENIARNKEITIEEKNYTYTYLFMGVPHCVVFLKESLSEEYLCVLGRKIRFDEVHFPEGTNVSFVEAENKHTLFVRTYERGVEEITLSCGTGSLSSAIVYSLDKNRKSPFKVRTNGGDLNVDFKIDREMVRDITLVGEVKMIARGKLLPQSYIY